jgi:hypothetical protein
MVKRMSNKSKSKRVVIVKRKSKATTPTVIGRALRALGGLGGGYLGGMVGHPSTGAALGSGLGASMSRFLGQGDYVVTSNSLVNRFRTSGDIPNMHRNGQSVVVRHREYISDVASSTSFNVGLSYALNPGLAGSFPWLSGIAQQYQEYTWKGVVYEFVSTSGDVVASSNTALGSVMMATTYRSTATPFIDKQQMLNEYFSTDAKPSECFCHPIECNPKENPFNVQYIRTGAVPAGEDPKTYDLGTFNLATVGMQASSVDIGELWVTYEVELRKPQLSSALDSAGSFASYYATGSPTGGSPFPNSITKNYDSIGIYFSSNTIYLPQNMLGTWLLTISFGTAVSVSTNNTWLSGATLSNCVAGIGNSYNASNWSNFTGDGTSYTMFQTYVSITNPALNATFSPSFGTITGATTVAVRMVQVPTVSGSSFPY